jgi:surfactin synthase thioesterase subunit
VDPPLPSFWRPRGPAGPLPARGRVGQLLPADVDKITEQLLGLSDQPTLFFGHSMGAILAFEVAWRLEGRGRKAPLRVIAPGRRAHRDRAL